MANYGCDRHREAPVGRKLLPAQHAWAQELAPARRQELWQEPLQVLGLSPEPGPA